MDIGITAGQDTDGVFLSVPDALVERMGWKDGTTLVISKHPNGLRIEGIDENAMELAARLMAALQRIAAESGEHFATSLARAALDGWDARVGGLPSVTILSKNEDAMVNK